MDPHTALCTGCDRSLDEIVAWASLCEEERARIMRSLPKRRTAAQAIAASTGTNGV